MAYAVTNKLGQTYFLHGKQVTLRGGSRQQIYYFARKEKDDALNGLPEGYKTTENPRTGLPMLRSAWAERSRAGEQRDPAANQDAPDEQDDPAANEEAPGEQRESALEQAAPEAERSSVVELLYSFARDLAIAVAESPRELMKVEWRDVERMLAHVFEGLGFKVELTPPSKDGGKDIVIQGVVGGAHRKYYVEVKHWRSGTKVGIKPISAFAKVVIRDGADRGLLLATSGVGSNTTEILAEAGIERINLGDGDKIAFLCRIFARANGGLLMPLDGMDELIWRDTHVLAAQVARPLRRRLKRTG